MPLDSKKCASRAAIALAFALNEQRRARLAAADDSSSPRMC